MLSLHTLTQLVRGTDKPYYNVQITYNLQAISKYSSQLKYTSLTRDDTLINKHTNSRWFINLVTSTSP